MFIANNSRKIKIDLSWKITKDDIVNENIFKIKRILYSFCLNNEIVFFSEENIKHVSFAKEININLKVI